jgi:predicted ATPase
MLDELSKSIKKLNHQSPHILKLRFPNYRNLVRDTELPLDFPITILLGRNGTNKSSILHALYGSVMGNSVGDYWFETELDAIPEASDGLKQSIVHTYKDENGKIVECIKARAPRGRKDPDYWEPVKHSQKYGFQTSGERGRPIQIKAIHLDFRGELPAFDKYFYFPDPKHLERRNTEAKRRQGDDKDKLRRNYRPQDYLRQRAPLMKKAILKDGVDLTSEELEVLCYILERKYVSAKILRHSLLHGHSGYTILFNTQNIDRYSDAFAGSGESAAFLLVHQIFQAPENSLMLLDEPETSLHPRAQQRMMQFIAQQAAKKNLQFVIATHSQYLSEGLPQDAIRVLMLNENGQIAIRTDISVDESIHEVLDLSHRKVILVEDERAKLIILSALKIASPYAAKEFKVIVRDGGTSRIYSDIQGYVSAHRQNISIIFDGDHNFKIPIPLTGELPQGEKQLHDLIRELTRGNSEKGPDLKFWNSAERLKYIEFLRNFVDFIPELTPEHFVWDDLAAQEILGEDLPTSITDEINYKKRLEKLAELQGILPPDAIFATLLSKVLKGDSPRKISLMKVIDRVRSR